MKGIYSISSSHLQATLFLATFLLLRRCVDNWPLEGKISQKKLQDNSFSLVEFYFLHYSMTH